MPRFKSFHFQMRCWMANVFGRCSFIQILNVSKKNFPDIDQQKHQLANLDPQIIKTKVVCQKVNWIVKRSLCHQCFLNKVVLHVTNHHEINVKPKVSYFYHSNTQNETVHVMHTVGTKVIIDIELWYCSIFFWIC